MTRARFEQRAVDGEVLVREELVVIGDAPHRIEERLGNIAGEEPVAFLREDRGTHTASSGVSPTNRR